MNFLLPRCELCGSRLKGPHSQVECHATKQKGVSRRFFFGMLGAAAVAPAVAKECAEITCIGLSNLYSVGDRVTVVGFPFNQEYSKSVMVIQGIRHGVMHVVSERDYRVPFSLR